MWMSEIRIIKNVCVKCECKYSEVSARAWAEWALLMMGKSAPKKCSPAFRGNIYTTKAGSTCPWIQMCCKHPCWEKTWEINKRKLYLSTMELKILTLYSVLITRLCTGFKVWFKNDHFLPYLDSVPQQESWEAQPFREVQITQLAVTWTKTNSLCLWWLRERHLAYI